MCGHTALMESCVGTGAAGVEVQVVMLFLPAVTSSVEVAAFSSYAALGRC